MADSVSAIWRVESSGRRKGQGGEDEFGFAHVVAEVVGLEAFEFLVLLDGYAGPLLVDQVGQDGELLARFDLVSSSVVDELVAGLLVGHALSYPFVTAALLAVSLASAIDGERGVSASSCTRS